MNTTPDPSRKISAPIISLIMIVLLVAASAGIYALTEKSNDTSVSMQDSKPDISSSSGSNASNVTTSYKDGTYSATGQYSTPGGSESITVKVTLSSSVVSAVEANGSATGGNSAEYQSRFLSNYKDSVVGKSVSDIKLSRVAGSSLTSTGFNDAIEQIKTDAEG